MNLPFPNWFSVALLISFLVLQLARTGENYFVSQLHTGGSIHDFRFGSTWLTSNNSIRTDELYKCLTDLGAKEVYAEFFIAMPLRFYDLEKHRFENVSIIENTRIDSTECPRATFAVVYVGGIRRMKESDFDGFTLVHRDKHFAILRAKN